MRTLAVLALLLGTFMGAGFSHRAEALEQLSWMAGCWQASSGERSIEEQWMRPRAGSMLGMSRTIHSDATVAHEFMRIVEREGQLVFIAQPAGQTQTEFVASQVEEGAVVFANPEHDFPQRILYRRAGEDSLIARIEGLRSGQLRGIDFQYARASCW